MSAMFHALCAPPQGEFTILLSYISRRGPYLIQDTDARLLLAAMQPVLDRHQQVRAARRSSGVRQVLLVRPAVPCGAVHHSLSLP